MLVAYVWSAKIFDYSVRDELREIRWVESLQDPESRTSSESPISSEFLGLFGTIKFLDGRQDDRKSSLPLMKVFSISNATSPPSAIQLGAIVRIRDRN